ncbi:hypothetical protein D3P07_23750 [Paenibacillus sp. 1011MAR3C5]|uniref:hypothetical protein n=1 Tax=Paenibacillus sp. 1011MAR3C5 TaxID=1675787 RepID=UPI000E6C4F5C|nr:hypothetical protein [Paenibacillus sp. 1011MAR3C5]RJE84377.1 hypothetical protein D3P07_23750 [Paenibacillus sp. 1011MAR3C5]
MSFVMRAKLNLIFLFLFTLPTWVAGSVIDIRVVPLLIGSWLGYNIYLFSNPSYKPFNIREIVITAAAFAIFYGTITKDLQESALIAAIMAICLYFFIPRHNRILYADQRT